MVRFCCGTSYAALASHVANPASKAIVTSSPGHRGPVAGSPPPCGISSSGRGCGHGGHLELRLFGHRIPHRHAELVRGGGSAVRTVAVAVPVSEVERSEHHAVADTADPGPRLEPSPP